MSFFMPSSFHVHAGMPDPSPRQTHPSPLPKRGNPGRPSHRLEYPEVCGIINIYYIARGHSTEFVAFRAAAPLPAGGGTGPQTRTLLPPFASPIASIRDAAIGDVLGCLEFFEEAGAEIVTVHPDNGPGAIELETRISLNALSFKILSDEAAKLGLTIAVENVPGVFSSVEALASIFESVPGLGFVLDVGHAFIRRNRFAHLLSAFKDKLHHIHLSDNRLHEDDHLPLGAGRIVWEDVVPAIKKAGYDSTFTLEIFSNDRRYIIASRDKLKELWSSS